MEHLPLLLKTTVHVFARKIHRTRSHLLLAALERLRYVEVEGEKQQKKALRRYIALMPCTFLYRNTVYDVFPIRRGCESDVTYNTVTDSGVCRSAGDGITNNSSISISSISISGSDDKNSSSNSSAISAGVTSLLPQRPVSDLQAVVAAMDWLVPLGMAHLERMWDDEHTPTEVLERVETYIASLATANSHVATNQSLKMTPAQVLHVLDVARIAREEIEKVRALSRPLADG